LHHSRYKELSTNGLLLRYHSNDYAFSQSKHPPCVVLKLTEHNVIAALPSISTTCRPVLSWTTGDQSCGTIDLFQSNKIQNVTADDLLSRPAVATSKLFCVLSGGKEILFEAKSEKEKRRISQGLNLIFNWLYEVGANTTMMNPKPNITNYDVSHPTRSNDELSGSDPPCCSPKYESFMSVTASTDSEDKNQQPFPWSNVSISFEKSDCCRELDQHPLSNTDFLSVSKPYFLSSTFV
jgi:hypothetical protein